MNVLELLPGIGKVIDKVIPDADKKQEMKFELQKMDAQQEAARLGVLKEMMGHKSVFVAGGIPALIWLAVLYILANHIIYPLLGAFGFVVTPISMPSEYWSLLNLIIGCLFGKKVIDGNEWRWGGEVVSPAKKEVEARMIKSAISTSIQPSNETKSQQEVENPESALKVTPSCDYDDPADVDRRLNEIAAGLGMKR